MNCFEARQEFVGFWRRELSDETRSAFLAHLNDCVKCDRAFRAFAITAPVLHSAAEAKSRAVEERPFTLQSRLHRLSVVNRNETPQKSRRWFAMCAAITVFVAGSLAAYLSVTTANESLIDALGGAQDISIVQPFGQDAAFLINDFAG